ncbi:MAG: ATP-binding cassette domain-containing protein [Lachnospiraceae bacterium]|nr:ATP-binding cassette domain-containing protein [Lachnospiraceae bacterium]
MDYILSTANLTKQYGKNTVVNAVNLHVRQGEIYGLIGKNGAGKTTFLKMAGGLAAPTSGEISLFGKTGRDARLCRTRVGSLIEAPGIYPNMTAEQNLRVKCIAMGVRDKDTPAKLLDTVGLGNTGSKKAKNFSLGMRQRLGIALALVGAPDLILLDEPINGLDPQGIVEVRETLARLNEEYGITMIISSHILEELSKLATHYGIIDGGMLLKELSREELLKECSERIELRADQPQLACTVLESMGIHNYKVTGGSLIQIFERLEDTGDITMALAKQGIKTVEIVVKQEALEQYYLNMTAGAKSRGERN